MKLELITRIHNECPKFSFKREFEINALIQIHLESKLYKRYKTLVENGVYFTRDNIHPIKFNGDNSILRFILYPQDRIYMERDGTTYINLSRISILY